MENEIDTKNEQEKDKIESDDKEEEKEEVIKNGD